METINTHCNRCGGATSHELLFSETVAQEVVESGLADLAKYQTLKCLGCGGVILRYAAFFDKSGNPQISFSYPPPIFRKMPHWLEDWWLSLPEGNEFVERLLKEVYAAIQHRTLSLAVMGIRALLEQVMISKCGDAGSFKANLKAFEGAGFVSKIQREYLETVFEAGHAAMHRQFVPEYSDVVTLLDITENIVETLYVHRKMVDRLKSNVPARKPSA